MSEDKLEDHANEIHVTLTGLAIMAVYCLVSAFAGIWTGKGLEFQSESPSILLFYCRTVA